MNQNQGPGDPSEQFQARRALRLLIISVLALVIFNLFLFGMMLAPSRQTGNAAKETSPEAGTNSEPGQTATNSP